MTGKYLEKFIIGKVLMEYFSSEWMRDEKSANGGAIVFRKHFQLSIKTFEFQISDNYSINKLTVGKEQ